MTREQFLEAVEAFLRETGMADRQLGIEAVHDAAFVKTLRDGRECRERTRQRVLEVMGKHREKLAAERAAREVSPALTSEVAA